MFTKCVNTADHHHCQLLLNVAPTNQLLRKRWKDKQMVHNVKDRECYKNNIYKMIRKITVSLVVC